MKKGHSLSSKITIFTMLVILLSTFAIAIIVYSVNRTYFLQQATFNLESETRLVANDIENSLVKIVDDLVILAKTPPIQGIIRSAQNNGKDPIENSDINLWKDRLAMIFTAMLKVNKNYTQIRYLGLDENGKEIVRVNSQDGEIYRTHESSLQSKQQEIYFKKGVALSLGSFLFSAVDYNKEYGKLQKPLTPTLRVLMPVYTNRQKLFGLLIININIQKYIKEILMRDDIKYNIILYDPFNDFFVYDSRNKRLSFYRYGKVPNKLLYGSIPVQSIPQLKSKLAMNNKLITVDMPIYSDFHKIYKALTLLVSVPKKVFLQTELDAFARILLSIGVICILASLLIYFFSKNTMRHLSEMAATIEHATQTRSAKLDLPIHLNDEVGLLARAFDKKTKLLSQLALFDSLTGLANRKSFMDHLGEAIHRAKRSGKLLGLVFLDLNHFKEVNDTYGHDYGDELLIKFSYELKRIIRETDLCARLSGDEFAILLENIEDKKSLLEVVQRYAAQFNKSYMVNGISLHITVSSGVAIFPDDSLDPDELLKLSDQAMYISKQEGQGQIHFYNKSDT